MRAKHSPSARFGHVACFVDSTRMVVFGGCDKTSYKWFSSVHILDVGETTTHIGSAIGSLHILRDIVPWQIP